MTSRPIVAIALLGAAAITGGAGLDPDPAKPAAAPAQPAPVQPPDGPHRQFRDPLIENLAGDWSLTRQIRGKEAHNTVHAEWVLNHQFLQVHMKDAADPPTYEAIVLIGYIYAEERYIAHWCDTFGGAFSAIGKGARHGDAIEFRFEYPDGPFFNTFTWDPAAKSWTCRLENSDKAGARTLFAIDALKRP